MFGRGSLKTDTGDTSISSNTRGDHQVIGVEHEEGTQENNTADHGTQRDLVLVMLQTLLGTSILALPACFRLCGIFLGTVTLVLCTVTTHYALYLFVLTANAVGANTYLDAVGLAIGYRMRVFAKTCTLLLQLGSLVACVNIFTDVLSFSAGGIIPPGADNITTWHTLVLLGMMPIMLLVKSTSYSMLRVVAYPSVLMVLGFIFLFAGNFTNSSLSHRAMVYVHPEGALTALPIIICGLHSILFSVFQFPEIGRAARMSAIRSAMLLCLLLYWLMGVSGYAVYGEDTAGDILRNLDGVLMGNGNARMVKGIFGVNMLLLLPNYTEPLQESIRQWFEKQAHMEDWLFGSVLSKRHVKDGVLWIASVTLLFLALSTSVFLPNLEFTIGLTGATAGVIACYFFPCYAFLKLRPEQVYVAGEPNDPEATVLQLFCPRLNRHAALQRLARAILCVGVLVAVSCTTYTVYAIRQEATVVQMATLLSRLNNRHQELTQQLTSAALVVETMKDVDQMKQNLQTGMSAAAHSVDSASWSLGAHINQSAADQTNLMQEQLASSARLMTNLSSEVHRLNATWPVANWDEPADDSVDDAPPSGDAALGDEATASASQSMHAVKQHLHASVEDMATLADAQRGAQRHSAYLNDAAESMQEAVTSMEQMDDLALQLDNKTLFLKGSLRPNATQEHEASGDSRNMAAWLNITRNSQNQTLLVEARMDEMVQERDDVSIKVEDVLRAEDKELSDRALRIATAMSSLTGRGTGGSSLNMTQISDRIGVDGAAPRSGTEENS